MPLMNAHVAFSVALSLLALLPSLSPQEHVRTLDSFSDQYETAVNGPPGRSKWNGNIFSELSSDHNKWGGGGTGPPSGRGPPGLGGGGPPGSNGKRPPGRNIESSSKGENYPRSNNGENYPRPNNNENYSRPNNGENYPRPNNGENYPRPNNGENYSRPNNNKNYPSSNNNEKYLHPNNDENYPSSNNDENYPRPNNGENYPRPNNGENYSHPNNNKNYPSSNNGENYPHSNNGGNYPRPNNGENNSRPNNNKNYPSSNNDEQYPRPNNNENYPSSNNGENYPHSNNGGNYPRPNNGENNSRPNNNKNYPSSNNDEQYPRPNNNENYPSSNNGENYPHSNNGGNYPRPNNGENYPRSNNGEKYPHPNNGENHPRPNNGENYPSSNNGENYPSSNKGENYSRSNDKNYPQSNNDKNYPYSNNGGSTQRPYPDREGPHGPDDRVPDRNEYPQNRQCRVDEFRCESNECLPQSVKCDNKNDCRDASDEKFCVKNKNERNGCVLPEQPEGGHYELSDCDEHCTKRPGDIVPKNSILNFTCKSNYMLKGNTISVCVDNEWYQPPSCRKICSPLNSTSVDISCSYQGETVSCSERILPGTRATLACKSSYKLPLTNDPAYREITCLDDGLWDRRLFRCLPECGTSIARGNTLIVNGFQAKVGVFPWHIGIYAKEPMGEYQQICAGALINNNLVVSAAHCFYDEVYNKLDDKSKYAVAAGKHYRDWNAREKYVQKSSLESIQLGGRYQGARSNFADDIVLLKLKTPFELTTLVRPVCIDWDNTYEREQLQVGHSGKVVGWGKDIKGEAAKSLQEIDMPFVPYDQCLSAVPVNFRGYLTSDKFCAGYLNGSSVCDGDSGGGLCFEKDGIWYLRGIVSVSPQSKGSCDYNSYVGFTSISHFLEWIREAYVNVS